MLKGKKEKEDPEESHLFLDLNKEEERRKQEIDVMNLKYKVADTVKRCLMKKREKKAIEKDEDFTNLARNLSLLIRGEIMERHQLCANTLLGVSLTEQDREGIKDQVHFYFVIDDIVRDCLIRLGFSQNQQGYEEHARRFCEEFHRKVRESIRVLKGSMKEEEVRSQYESTIIFNISQSIQSWEN